MKFRALPFMCLAITVAGCGRWAWENPDSSVPAPQFQSDNCECLGERIEVQTSVPLEQPLYDCKLKPGRSVDTYNQCMEAKGYVQVWKRGSP